MSAPSLLLLAHLSLPVTPGTAGDVARHQAGDSVQAATESTDYLAEHILAEGAKVVKLAGDLQFTEGPVWIDEHGGGYLVFSDIPVDELKRWKDGELTTFRKPSHKANGNLLDETGALVTCEHGSRTVTRTDTEGNVETLVGDFEGKKLNSPNALAIRSDGMIWFTDPPYGLRGRPRELEQNNVFCFDRKTGTMKVVVSDFDRPNGMCLAPDEKRLYVADSGKSRHIRVFEVQPDGTLEKGRIFCRIDVGGPDGIRCDRAGRVFSSAGDGVHVFDPKGKLLGKIPVPESPANLCFGGPEGTTLFITARTGLYSIETKVEDAWTARRKEIRAGAGSRLPGEVERGG